MKKWIKKTITAIGQSKAVAAIGTALGNAFTSR